MQILDEDMQMVRDFLNQWGAPEYVKGHFENLVTEHAKEAARVDDLEQQVRDFETEESARVASLEERIDELERENQAEVDEVAEAALIAVKYWLHDALVLNVPMRTMPRDILRQVENAL